MGRIVLYDYYRSSACYRVRIALNLKRVDYEKRTIDLRAGDQQSDQYREVNPQGLVPLLEIDGHRLTQSLAIINYLDLRFPVPPLIPASAAERSTRPVTTPASSPTPTVWRSSSYRDVRAS